MSPPPALGASLTKPRVLAATLLTLGLAAGCSSTPAPETGATPASDTTAAAGPVSAGMSPALPPIPHVSGPLAISVVYPRAGATVAVRDSNFILGSLGTGEATLAINGANVPVEANGAFLAWLPVPDSATSRYDLVAVHGSDTVRFSQPIRIPPRHAATDSVDTVLVHVPFPDSGHYEALGLPDPVAPPTLPDTDRAVIARPTPGGTYKWFFLPGTVLQVTGRSGNFIRVRLDSALDVWVSATDARLGPSAIVAAAPHRVVPAARVSSGPGFADVILPVSDRPPYLIEESGNDLVLTLYGTQASVDLIQYDSRDSLVRAIGWEQVTGDRARFTIHLSRPPFGYLVLWDEGAHRLILRIRRPPKVDPSAPLKGRIITVDAGHPPIGATGPTGLWEPVATLAVAEQLEAELTKRGAQVVMTRTTPDPVDLYLRPVIARRANADALVSIHLNALPDGTNPFIGMGSGTYFFQAQAVSLARAVQAGMVHHMGLHDRGIFYDNLALARPTWMPSVLCEGAFIIVPQQEAALRTPEFQRAYALGVADGLEAFFRSLAAQ